jgi:hypothetical protein
MKNLYGLKKYQAIASDLKEQLRQLSLENKDETALKVLSQKL